jgi:hypothetical protein
MRFVIRTIRARRHPVSKHPSEQLLELGERLEKDGYFGDPLEGARGSWPSGRQNVPLAEAVGLTALCSVQPALRYFQSGVVQHTRAADSLGNSAPEES